MTIVALLFALVGLAAGAAGWAVNRYAWGARFGGDRVALARGLQLLGAICLVLALLAAPNSREPGGVAATDERSARR